MNSIQLVGRSIRDLQPEDLVFVLFHGREGTPADMAGAAAQLARPTDAVLIPQADSGTWFPLSTYSPICQNQPMLTQSLSRIETLLLVLGAQGVTRNRIVLVGFSQGACLVAQFLLQYPARYALAIIFSGGALGLDDELVTHPGSLEQTPVLMSSSQVDPYMRWSRIEKTAGLLRAMGAETTLLGYEQASHAITARDYAAAKNSLDFVRRAAGTR